MSEDQYIERISSDVSKRLGYKVFGVHMLPVVRSDVYNAVNALRDIDKLKRDLLPKIDYRLEYVTKKFKKTAIVLNVIGALLLGLGLIVTLPLTYIIYKFRYGKVKEDLLEELDRVNSNIAVLERKYNTLIDEIARKINSHVSRRHSAVLYGDRLVIIENFEQLNSLLSEKDIVIEHFNCPVCNSVLPLPRTGKVFVCPHCGLRIKPVDVFKQLKEIYGL